MKFHSLPAKSGPAAALLRCLAALLLFLPGLADAQTWVQSLRSGNEMQFLFTNSIQRYDLTSRTWLGTINLPRSGATALTGDATGNFVAYGTAIYRYSTTYTGEAAAGTANSSIASLFLDGNLLIAVHSTGLYARLTSYNRTTGTQLNTIETYVDSIYGTSHAPGLNKIFGRTQGISPADIVVASYTDAGLLSGPAGSPYHGTYPGAAQTFTAPDERRVMDSSGTVYSAADLTYLGILGGTVTDMDWNGDIPIVLRGSELISFTNTLMEAGRTTLASAGTELAVTSTDALVFAAGSPQPVVRIVPLSQLQAPTPGQPVNPNGLPYTVDDAFQDKDGVIHLLSKAQFSLFRWSTAQRLYQTTLPLVASPSHVSYSATSHSVFTASGQVIRKMDLAAPSPVEVAFANLPSVAGGLATAGEFLYAVKSDGYMTFSPTGTVLTNSGFTYYVGSQNTYDPVRRRIYHFRDGISPNDLHFDTIGNDGRVTTAGETPYHGDFPAQTPIRVSPDGNRILIGSGVIFNAADLTTNTSLANSIADGVWKNGTLFSIRLIGGLTQVQSWTGAQFTAGPAVRQFSGTPVRLFNTADGLLLITALDGAPRFTLLNDALEPVYISPSNPSAPGALMVSGRTVDSISLQWADVSDNEDGFRVEYRASGTTGAWLSGASAAAGATQATVPGLLAGTTFEFRVLATNTTLVSAPSASVTAATLTSSSQPVGEPYNLAVARIFHNSITLAWKDNANNETAFRILRSTTAGGATTALTAPANSTSYTDSAVAANTTYYYRIQAVNGVANGDLSAQVSARTLSAASVPAAPFNLVTSDLTPYTVRLSWSDSSSNEDYFIVEQSSNPVTTWTEVDRPAFNSTTTEIEVLTPNTSYSLRVRAVNATGSGTSYTVLFTTPKLGGDFLGMGMRGGDIYYFAFNGPHRIERYDLVNRAWLSPLPLDATVTALWVDEAGIYAAEGRALLKWSLDGTIRTPLINAASNITLIATAEDVLMYSTGAYDIPTINKRTGVAIGTFTSYYFSSGVSYDPVRKRVFVRDYSNISALDIGPDGKLIRNIRGPYSGQLPTATRTFVFPAGGRVADNGGTVYNGDSLEYSNSLGTAFSDLAFHGTDVPIVLRGNKLLSYSNTLLEAGSYTLGSANGQRVAVDGTDAIAFLADGSDVHGMTPQIVPLGSLNAPEPGLPVLPDGLPYTVDDAFVDRDGVIYLYSKSQSSLFRWSPALRRYQSTLPLLGSPSNVAYSSFGHMVYTAYATQLIRRMFLTDPLPAETPFANLPDVPYGLVAAGPVIYASTGNRVLTFSALGVALSNTDSLYRTSRQNTWDPMLRRIYHFRDGLSPDDLLYDTLSTPGQVTPGGDSPYHGDVPIAGPIRVSPDGNFVLLGSGVVFNSNGLTKAAALSSSVVDGLWKETTLVTLRLINGLSQLQTWTGSQFTAGAITRQFTGTPVRLFDTPSGLLVITSLDGMPRFTLLNDAYDPVFISPVKPVAPGALTVTLRTTEAVSLQWTDLSDNEDGFRIEYRGAGTTGPWLPGAATAAGATTGTVAGLTAGTGFEFRVLASNAGLLSAATGPVNAFTLISPDQPAGEPYFLAASRVFHNSITLVWRDNATNETGFRLLRSTTPGGVAFVRTTAPNATLFTDTGLAVNTTYYYRIQAVNGTVDGDLSPQLTVATLSAASSPAAPSQFVHSDLTSSTVRVSWQDNSTNEENFIVDRSVSPYSTWTEAGRTGFNGTSLAVSGLLPNTAYALRVRAANSSGSNASPTIYLTTLKTGGEFLGFSSESGGISYFAFSGPDRIERYHLTNRAWLAPVPMQTAATALWVDESGIYAAEGRSLIKWDLTGASRTAFAGALSNINLIVAAGDVLAYQGNGFATVNKLTGIALDSFATIYYSGSGASYDPVLKRIFMRTTGIGPSDIFFVDIGPDGKLIGSTDSPYHGSYPDASRTFVFPAGGRVADNSGTVYSTDSLTYSNSLGGALTDLTFRGSDVPIVLRGNKLLSYANTLLEAGSFTLGSANGLRVAVNGSDAIVFISDAANPHGLSLEIVPLSSLNAPGPGQPVNPAGLPYTVDDAFLDRDGVLHLYSGGQLSLFRWSTAQQAYQATIPLLGAPSYISYSDTRHAAYTAYAGQIIRKLDLTAAAPAEAPFANLPSPPYGLGTAGDFLYVVKNGGFVTFSPAGAQITNSGFTYYVGAQNTWDPVRRRLYHFRDPTSPNDLHYDNIALDGVATVGGETPYHGDFNATGPIRVSPDGNFIVIGSGVIFRSSDMTRVITLSAALTDMAWQESLMVGLEALGTDSTKVQRWSTTWGRQQSMSVGGTPLRLFALSGNRLLVVTKHTNGVPRFHILDSTLTSVFDSIPTPPAIVQQPASTRVPFGATAAFQVLATGSPPLAYQWYRADTLIPGATGSTLALENAGSADAGAYKVIVTNAAGTVTSANAVLAVGPVAAPSFAAGNLLVSAAGRIYEYTAVGVLVKSIAVAAGPGVTNFTAMDLAVDGLGRIHVLTNGLAGSSFQYYISSYDPGIGEWQHTRIPEAVSNRIGGEGLLTITGDWLLARSYRMHLQTRETVPLPSNFAAEQIVTAPDGRLYGVAYHGEVQRLSTSTWTWSAFLTLQPSEITAGFAIAADGRMWAGNSNTVLKAFTAAGVQSKTLTLPGLGTYIRDVSVSPTQLMALGQTNGGIILTDSAIASSVRVLLPGNLNTNTYTAWMPAIAQPAPAFVAQALPLPAVEDIAWSWTPQVAHPDPDAVLTLSAVQLPPWLSLAGGQLSGTPLQPHVGANSVILSVREGSNPAVQETFTVQVAEVNDAPLATNSSLTRSEDAPAEEVILTALSSDEETASGALAFSIISTTGGVVNATLDGPSDSSLRLTYLPDAYGTAAVTVRATDAGGLFADSVIAIAVAPVNDPPAGLLEPLALHEDAAAVDFNLDDFFSDMETADNALVFHVTSTGPAIATATLSGHVLRITPQANAFGGLTVVVRCQDPDSAFVEFPLPVIVQPVNDLPAGSLADLTLDEDALPVVLDLAAAFADIETPDAGLRFTAVSSAPGLVSGTLSGSLLILAPQKDANGSLFVSIGCTDADGGLLDVRFNVNVKPVNDPPVIPAALPAIAAGEAGADTVLDFAPFVTDPDIEDLLTWRVVSNSNPSLFTRIDFDARGRLTIHYAPYVSGRATVTVEVSDQAGITAQRSFTVDLPIPAAPSLETSSTLVVNRQTGLWEQRITVRNAGQRAIGGFEITVTGLPAGASLYNASDARPPVFIAGYYQPLAAGESVTLMLEYYSPTRGSLSPVLSTAAVLPREGVSTAAGAAVSIDRMLMLEPGAFLLEFTAVPGELYQVQYSTGGAWADSWVRIRAAGNRVQWIDRGAPRTSSPPQPGKSRFYRVKHLAAP